MKNSVKITAIIDQPGLLEDKIEQLAYHHHPPGPGRENVPADRITLETSSVETYVTGHAVMNNPDAQISRRFITPFVFTCIKIYSSVYKVEWSSSLS